ncbi:HDR137Cp [Eremothecium sinecaudum]|uniref:HDR137Cp n=1 Tax=Eremothecium sinecaudum TaxID=45286 RepID=A0A0X8HSX6_9SACH|nr:HDR137Cp [Eremothecium sinecaudum]AMD20879.1 HDR137Cp [Eremothecium sinecaudum]
MAASDIEHHADYSNATFESKEEALVHLIDSYKALANEQDNFICNLANASSLLWYTYKELKVNVNWTGFYFTDPKRKDHLILGPFQGKVACQLIKFGKGVCGTAASTKKSIVVQNVNEYPGHIACDGETKSEIVVPIIVNGATVAVIDLDCLDYNAFDDIDRKYLGQLANAIASSCVF